MGSGADLKKLMGMSPANMLPEEELDENNFVFHTIYRTTPLMSPTVGTIVVMDQKN